MGTPITTQNLIDAGTDAANLASVVNGPGTGAGSTVTMRNGSVVQTVAAAIDAIVASQPLIPKGNYSATTTYAIGNTVRSGTATYASLINANLNNTPATSPTQWGLIAQDGATGASGSVTNLATTPGIALTPSGATGVSTSVARADHTHPSELANNPVAPTTLVVGTDATMNRVRQGTQAVQQDTPKNARGYIDGVTDGSGNFQMGIMPDGRQEQNTGLGVINGFTADTAASPIANHSQSHVAQRFIGLSQVEQEMVANTLNFIDGVTDGNGKFCLLFTKDGDIMFPGTVIKAPVHVATAPVNDLTVPPAQVTLLNTYRYFIFPVTGQSLGNGAYSVPPISTSQKYNNLMLNGGVRDGIGDGQVAASSGMTSLVPLVESTDPAVQAGVSMGQTICSSMGQVFALEMALRGFGQPGVWAVSDKNGTPYTGIMQGTQTFANLISYITAMKSLLGSVCVISVPLIHGEDDDFAANPYANDISTLQANYQTAIQAITGQTNIIPIQLCQQNSWTNYHSRATPFSAIQQLLAAETWPTLVYFVTPKYMLLTAAGNGVHLSATSEYILGEYHGKCAVALASGGTWTGVRPRPNYPIRLGATLIVDFYVPVGPLTFDTVNVSQPTNVAGSLYGFEFAYINNSDGSVNATAAPAIINAQISGSTTVILTLASVPVAPSGTTMHLRYAFTGVVGASAGPFTGPRGNLRDSDYYPSQLDGRPLYNWCAAFDKPVS